MANPVLAENAAGDVAIGVEVDGAFIPIASVQKHRIDHLVERHNDLLEKVEADDPNAKEVMDNDFAVGSKSKPKAAEKGGES